MKKKIKILNFAWLAICSLILFACGGGGIPKQVSTVIGRILDIRTGTQLSSPATVQFGSLSAQTSSVDGSFSVASVPRSVTSFNAVAPASIGYPIFTFDANLTSATVDVGDVWIGPETITIVGKIFNSGSGSGIAGGKIRFAGREATTLANGSFTLSQVAYSSANTASFLGIVGKIEATGFFTSDFTANGQLPISGTLNLGEIALTPLSSTDPPGIPFTVWGRISPTSSAPGTLVTLSNLSGTTLRSFSVGADGRYQFWVLPGSYQLNFVKGILSAPRQDISLASTTDVIRADATLQ